MKPVPHRHCSVCGKAVESEAKLCSDGCRGVVAGQRRRQRLFILLFFAIMGSLLFLNWTAARAPAR